MKLPDEWPVGAGALIFALVVLAVACWPETDADPPIADTSPRFTTRNLGDNYAYHVSILTDTKTGCQYFESGRPVLTDEGLPGYGCRGLE